MAKKRKELISIISFLIIFLFIFLKAATADVVVLENGDRLTGTVTKMEENTLTLTTGYSEPIQIKKSKIKSIQTEDSVDVHLEGGEILKGKLEISRDGRLSVESSRGREAAIIDWDKVTLINPAPPASFKWEGSVNIGAGLQSGNTDRASASVGAEATRKTSKERFALRFLSNYAEESGSETTRNTYGALKYDYFFTKTLFGYLSVELLNDKYKDLSLRTVVGPGVGYQVWDSSNRFLMLEVGVSYFSENLKSGVDSSWITGRLGGTFRYKILKNISVIDYLLIYPSLEDFGEYQLRNEAGISTDLGSNWSLNFMNILEHDSDPSVGVKKNDLQWILGLKYSL